MSETPTIARLTLAEISDADFARLSRIFVECFNAAPRREEWTENSARTYLANELDRGAWLWLAVDSGGIAVGFALVISAARSEISGDFPPELPLNEMDYVSVIAVDPALQGRGIGGSLVWWCVEDSRARGRAAISARTRSDAIAIQKILRRQGFNCAKRYSSVIGGDMSEREIHLLGLAASGDVLPNATWPLVDIYCLQSVALPDIAAYGLMGCGRSLIQGLGSKGRHPLPQAWRWEGWYLWDGTYRTEDAGWEPLVQPELFALAASERCRSNARLNSLLSCSLSAIPELSRGVQLDAMTGDFRLLLNDHGTFLLAVHFRVAVSPALARGGVLHPPLGDCLFELSDRTNRGVLTLMLNSEWGHAVRDLVNAEIRQLCMRWLRESLFFDKYGGAVWEASERFAAKTVHTFAIYGRSFTREQMRSVHRIEEFDFNNNLETIVAEKRADVFLQLGWSFSSVSGLTHMEICSILRLLVVLQMQWWFMRVCRRHLYDLGALAVDSSLPSSRLRKASEEISAVAATFNRFLIDHKRFQAAIPPREQLLFEELEKKWRLHEDFDLVREMEEDMRNLARDRTESRLSRNARLQSVALFVVAILQLFSLVSIVTDYRTLMTSPAKEATPTLGIYGLARPEDVTRWHVWLPVALAISAIILASLPFLRGIAEAWHRALTRHCLRWRCHLDERRVAKSLSIPKT